MIGHDDRNQIILALKIIQGECKKHGKCEDSCPFERMEECILRAETPNMWAINDNEKWKALR